MRSIRFTLLLTLGTLTACGSDATTSDSTDFDGVIAADNESGTISVTVATLVASVMRRSSAGSPLAPEGVAAAAKSANVTGSLKIKNGSAVNLSGTYDSDVKTFSVTGGGYSFTGSFTSGQLAGTYTGPKGNGAFSAYPGGKANVQLFCGTFTGDADGVWNLAMHGDALSGAFYTSGAGGVLTGGLSNTTIGLTFSGGAATGTLSGSSMSGQWATSNGDAGDWSGSKSACP